MGTHLESLKSNLQKYPKKPTLKKKNGPPLQPDFPSRPLHVHQKKRCRRLQRLSNARCSTNRLPTSIRILPPPSSRYLFRLDLVPPHARHFESQSRLHHAIHGN